MTPVEKHKHRFERNTSSSGRLSLANAEAVGLPGIEKGVSYLQEGMCTRGLCTAVKVVQDLSLIPPEHRQSVKKGLGRKRNFVIDATELK